MQNNIEQILANLYQSDPSLKQHDAALRKLVADLMVLKPNTQFDEQFKHELRRRLMAMAETNESSRSSSLTSNFMKRFQLVGAGMALIALLVASAWYLNGVDKSPNNFTTLLSGPKIIRADDNAFGSLAGLQSAGRGQGGGGNAAMADNGMAVAPSAAEGSSIPVDGKMIAPAPINIRYVYNGEELTLVQDKVDVLKRVKNEQNSGLSDFINRISLGLVDLNSFDNSQLQSFTFVENREKGYMVTVQMNEGSVNINEYWEKWPQLTCAAISSDTMPTRCPEPKRLKPEDIPADEVLINAANAFLDEHGIPRQNYGTPVVNKEWRNYFLRLPASEQATYWIPDMMSVIYPLSLNGQEVHDESGNLSGMNVTVRISPDISVSSVWDLTTQNYQSSSYTAETDVARVMKLVEKGGFRNYYYMEPNAKTVDVELGTPEVSLVKLWNYKNNTNEELLVPALIFPVTKEPTPEEVGPYGWYRKNVVIPLVKEILDNEDGGVRIMPLGGGMGGSEPAVQMDAPVATPAKKE
jgi:hypothetical protein